jgi:hypothetical protein
MVNLLEVWIFLRSLSLVCKAIRYAVGLSRPVGYLEVKACEKFGLSGLVIILQAIAGEVGQVLVIRDDLDSM